MTTPAFPGGASSGGGGLPSSAPLPQPTDLPHHRKPVYEILMRQTAEQQASAQQSSPTVFRYTPDAALHRPVPVYSAPPTHSASSSFRIRPGSGGGSGGTAGAGESQSFDRGTLTRLRLPYLTPWYPTPGPSASQPPPDFSWISESCGGKAAIGVFGGAVCGLLMGVFLGAMSDMTPPVTVINGKEVPQAPLKEQVRTTMRATGEKCIYWSRNFAFITGVFGGTECLVEKYRGKHDVWNSAIGGCVTGAALQAKQGPQAAAVGCGGFAVFSLVIDSVFPH